MTSAIYILNASVCVNEDELRRISKRVQDVFGVSVYLKPLQLDVEQVFDSSRGQYNSTLLLKQLLARNNSSDDKCIAVIDVDIFIPVLTFVFGEAEFDRSAAIVSTHRLSNQYYGLPHNHELLLLRLEKEIIHELGHTFGLYHCRQFECVMRSSTYVEEIDIKQVIPCSSCKEFLSNNRRQ